MRAPEHDTRAQFYVLTLAASSILVCSLFIALTVGLRDVILEHGDYFAYLEITNRILGSPVVPTAKHFWGLSYVMAAVIALTRLSPVVVYYLISAGSSLGAIWVVTRVWGVWVGLAFTASNWMWIGASSFGGADTLFALLVFLAIAQAQSRRYVPATLIASLATTVRPLGIFLVFVVLVTAWRERRLRTAMVCLLVSASIGLLYIVPLVRSYGDPLANLHAYQRQDWSGKAPVGLPMQAIVRNYINGENAGNVVIKHAKLAVVLLHIATLVGLAASVSLRRRMAEQPVVAAFALVYSAFLLTYNAPTWALSIYPRLLAPVLPFFLWLYKRWLPRNWKLWMAVAALSVLLACGAGLGVYRAQQLLQGRAQYTSLP